MNRHRETPALPNLDPAANARLRSQSGVPACRHITAFPSRAHTAGTLRGRHAALARTRTTRDEKPRLQGHTTPADGCASLLDSFGDHGSACPKTGELKCCEYAVERAWRPLWEDTGY